MEIFFHAANIIFVFSYLVTDILWLRALAVLGSLSSLTWAVTQPTVNPTFIGWSLVYTTVNVVQIVRLWHERRPLRLGADEQSLYAATFRALTPREFRRLLTIGHWQSAPADEVLIAQGTRPGRILVLASGRAAVKVDGRDVAALEPGQFAGEMSFLTGVPTSAAVEVVDPVRFVWWPTAELERFLRKHPELRAAVQLVLGKDLAFKLGREARGTGRASARP